MDLVDECWELVFEKLGDQHCLDAVSLVSKRFLSISSYLVHRLTISDPCFFIFSKSSFFQRFNHIKIIHIGIDYFSNMDLQPFLTGIARAGLSSSVDEIWFTNLAIQMPMMTWKELGSNFKNLKSLRFDNCTFRCSDLIAIALGIPRLQQLLLSRPSLMDKVDDKIMEEIASNLKGLRKVSIPDGRYVTSETLRYMSLNCVLLDEIVCDNKYLSNNIGIALRSCPNLNAVSMYGLHVDNANFDANELSFQKSISYARALCSIEFRDSHLSDALLCSIAKARLPLKKLRFYKCSNISLNGLSILLQEYRFLNSFQFRYSECLTDQHMDYLAKYLHSLTHINLSGSYKITSSTLFILAEICPMLVSIVMNDTCLGHGDEDEHGAVVWETKNTNLKFLDISHNSWTNDATLKKIGFVCPSLRTLKFNGTTRSNITNEGIGEFLKRCLDIRNLEMNHCKLEIILGASTADDSTLNIEVLEVSHSFIDDKEMEAIGNRCPRLRKLGLRGCSKVTMQGVMKVVDKCTNLMEIDLGKCLNVVGLDVQILKTRPSLRKIILTDVTDAVRSLFIHHGCRLSDKAPLESYCGSMDLVP